MGGMKELCGKVREACEEYGCFMVRYDGVPAELHKEMFMAMKDLFDLPVETKQKNTSHLPYRGYIGNSKVASLFESLGLDEAAQAFTQLIQTINSCISGKMQELELLILRMILESHGMPKFFDALAEISRPVFQMMKYKPPPASDDAGLGLDGEVIEVPSEMVDNKHPLLFRPYKYTDFVNYSNFNVNRNPSSTSTPFFWCFKVFHMIYGEICCE
ncbi:probable 2-oxoglutarate-dependent dioxygenase AOP1.2 [Telopea speciosissima]|uniref:probable 2-oxoglutarate-dependent dioxygenase AOP1.2 n=1 Tax=Telopea speciosissima TaxID=54955 RepID=UPI001CC40963|nr:probable 2-oxoglutarate-dependent dioxygenase AOP1.2 [Telopea speciosissima]